MSGVAIVVLKIRGRGGGVLVSEVVTADASAVPLLAAGAESGALPVLVSES